MARASSKYIGMYDLEEDAADAVKVAKLTGAVSGEVFQRVYETCRKARAGFGAMVCSTSVSAAAAPTSPAAAHQPHSTDWTGGRAGPAAGCGPTGAGASTRPLT